MLSQCNEVVFHMLLHCCIASGGIKNCFAESRNREIPALDVFQGYLVGQIGREFVSPNQGVVRSEERRVGKECRL